MRFLLDIIRGCVIGIANIIPGVSGGTMMVTMGIYDKLIGSITGIFKQFKKSIMTLLPYVIGMAVGIGAFAFLLTKVLLVKFPFPTALAFIGLIAGGVPLLVKKTRESKRVKLFPCILVFILFFALIIGMQFMGEGADKVIEPSAGTAVVLLVMGMLAAAAMVVPGVSGSLLLLAFGYYNPVTDALTKFISAVFELDMEVLLQTLFILLPFGIGVLLGIFFIAKVIEWLLANHERLTYSGILGLVCASPVPVFLNALDNPVGAGAVIGGVITFAAGFAVAYKMGRE